VRTMARPLRTGVWVFALACGWIDAPGVAQAVQPPPLAPRDRAGPEPLPRERRPDSDLVVVPLPPTPPTILKVEVRPINLTSALQLAGVQNPELNVARTRILEAAAARQLAAAYFLPSLNPGMNYDSHTGNLQQSDGNILGVNRSAFYIGAGANAVSSGTPTIPGVYEAINLVPGIYNYLAARQTVRQREFETVAVRNQIFLQVAWAYSELLRSEGHRAAQVQAREEVREVTRLVSEYAKTGLSREADANRAAAELTRREADVVAAEGELLVASANLCRLLNVDPSIRLHPTDATVVPQPIVPDPIPVGELVAIGMLNRPELVGQRAAIQAALMQLDAAKALPFSPTTLIGFSAGAFGGGSNLVRPIFSNLGGRTDFDSITYWTLQNLGLGNVAMIRVAGARLKLNEFRQIELLNLVRAQVAEAYAQAHARYAQIGTYENAVRAGYLAFHEDFDRTFAMGAARVRDVLPIELLNSFDLLADARIEYIDAIVDYNRAQFAIYVALGQPPANSLAHPVPTEGVQPSNLPRRAGPPANGGPAPNGGPVPDAAPAPAALPQGGVQPAGLRVPIPPPRNIAEKLKAAG
jgi:outer membrane protein TolC